ncbi:MAG: OmpA family protein [Verrucomicrobiota bacterium]
MKPVVVAKPEDKQVQKGMQKPEGQKQVVKAHKKTDGKSSADKKAVTKKPENQDLKKEGAVVVEKKEKPSIKSSFFALKSAANDDRDRILKDIQALLKEHPKTVVEIIGYANDMEWEQTNLDISRNRAEFLRSHLVFKGVPSKNLKATGKGAGDSGEKGRRVDFKLHGDN